MVVVVVGYDSGSSSGGGSGGRGRGGRGAGSSGGKVMIVRV